MCRYRYLLSALFALGFLSLFPSVSFAAFECVIQGNIKRSTTGEVLSWFDSNHQIYNGGAHTPHTGSYSGSWGAVSNDYTINGRPTQKRQYRIYANGSSSYENFIYCYQTANICDLSSAQSFADAANAESPDETKGPFAKPASGTGLNVSVGYQTENFCQNGCQATRLTAQDVSEGEYSYSITFSEKIYVQNQECGGVSGVPPYTDTSQITNYYIPPTAVRDIPPIRDPNAPPSDYPPNAPPPPDQPPPPPIDDDPPPPPPPQECLGAGCEPPPEVPPTGPPPEVPPFQEIITEPWACQFIDCHPPPKAIPPDTAVPTSESGGLPEPEPSGGCPSGTSWGSKNGVNGCYGQPSNGGQCGQGQYWGEVDGKEGCYGATVCKDGQVYGSIGDSDPKCYDLGSCYVKGDCNQECDPDTETCDSLKGQFSKDCKVTPDCGDADAIECAILRQSWVTSCDAVKTAGDISDCNMQFKCENDPVQCAIAKMHHDNLCNGDPDDVFNIASGIFEDHGFEKAGDFTDDDIFKQYDVSDISEGFLEGGGTLGSCPADINLPLFGADVIIPTDLICQFGIFVRALLILAASFTGLMLLYRSFINN